MTFSNKIYSATKHVGTDCLVFLFCSSPTTSTSEYESYSDVRHRIPLEWCSGRARLTCRRVESCRNKFDATHTADLRRAEAAARRVINNDKHCCRPIVIRMLRRQTTVRPKCAHRTGRSLVPVEGGWRSPPLKTLLSKRDDIDARAVTSWPRTDRQDIKSLRLRSSSGRDLEPCYYCFFTPPTRRVSVGFHVRPMGAATTMFFAAALGTPRTKSTS